MVFYYKPVIIQYLLNKIKTYLPLYVFVLKTYDFPILWNFNRITNSFMINVSSFKKIYDDYIECNFCFTYNRTII